MLIHALCLAAPIVFFDIAGLSSATLTRFYSEVFGWEVAADGRFSVPVSSPLPAVIRQDPSEKRIYLGVPDVAATLKLIKEKGGTLDSERFEVPGVVVLGLFKDPAGNPMGLVEMDGGRIKIP
jgi:predicted enzyme related to lactoylglutathione lyase